ncbi:2OG-Fe(II) oxygenase [Pedobacter riviphilus]|uniref:2OG-Fe(II) oxygenase n=1 Tax=Pedobacter riviphilus TaxID=2766984 RepID=A0ABX6TKV0_9SPHI|nr:MULTISPECIES: 2OG-Fe(II) oxygenase [Pedobacter]NII82026.1 SM-20-related protein [Pedobacter sp. SG908]NMN36030.1 SM-20-related protein [Pedobacter sp. SG918]QNR85836.1 2OG-Fe(II) oxygenase [Pedobacter riviphilus]
MEKIFDCLIDSFIENKVGIAENFLSVSLAAHLKDNLIGLFENKKLLNAGVGNDTVVNQNKLIRSDVIYWLDRKHNNQYENDFFNLMDEFVVYLNRTCYTGITGYEFHYTLYESGTFYKKHIDQFQNNGSRQYSMVMYLNADWKMEDGGELRIYHVDGEQNIAPNNGKSVFFRSSDLAHEVLLTNKQRMSITGWLKIG